MDADASDSEVSSADFALAESRTSLAAPDVNIQSPDGEFSDILANSSISESRIPTDQRLVGQTSTFNITMSSLSAAPKSKRKRISSGIPPSAKDGFTPAQEEFLSSILDALCDVSKKVNTISTNLERLDNSKLSLFPDRRPGKYCSSL